MRSWVWLLVVALVSSVPVAVWLPLVRRGADPSYAAFAHALGMTARYRYLLEPNEFLELRIPPGTPLAQVRKQLPRRYILSDTEVCRGGAYGPAEWVISLGYRDSATGDDLAYARLYFRRGPGGELVFGRSGAALYPFRYPRLVVTGVWLALWLVVCAMWRSGRARKLWACSRWLRGAGLGILFGWFVPQLYALIMFVAWMGPGPQEPGPVGTLALEVFWALIPALGLVPVAPGLVLLAPWQRVLEAHLSPPGCLLLLDLVSLLGWAALGAGVAVFWEKRQRRRCRPHEQGARG